MSIPTDAEPKGPALLTVQQLIDRWEGTTRPVSRTTLSRWRRLGVGPEFFRAGRGGKVFYRLESVRLHETIQNIFNL